MGHSDLYKLAVFEFKFKILLTFSVLFDFYCIVCIDELIYRNNLLVFLPHAPHVIYASVFMSRYETYAVLTSIFRIIKKLGSKGAKATEDQIWIKIKDLMSNCQSEAFRLEPH